MKLDNRWQKADGSLNELPISIHSREDWQVTADSGQFPICVQIAWHGKARDESNGYPINAEMQQIEVFHHQLQAQLELHGHSVITMVITHDGVNQWVIYTSDIEQLKTDLNQLAAPEQGFPIEIVADEDPDWQTFKKVYQAIQ